MLNEITVTIVPRSKVAVGLLGQNKRHVDARTRQKFDIVRPRMHSAAIFRGLRCAGAAAMSGVGLPGPATDHRNSFSSWQYLATWHWRAHGAACCLSGPRQASCELLAVFSTSSPTFRCF
ncbi:unnamed protein product, partial [Brenthis ino]